MNQRVLVIVFGLLAVAGSILGIFFYNQHIITERKFDELQAIATDRENALRDKIDDLYTQYTATLTLLDLSTEEKQELEDDLEQQRDKVDEIQEEFEKIEDEYNTINDTVNKLVKLNNTDEELLQKYSKVYFLNENYIPDRLEAIDSEYLIGSLSLRVHADVAPFLEELLEDADDDDMDLRILSAYRSFEYQKRIKANYVAQYGSGANTFSADQGYSEHQLGSTVDFTTSKHGSSLSQFESTDEFDWLQKNAYKYGFILSYPENNEYYQYEPWHWRFVGKDLARYLTRNNVQFYDLPQREIDEYLIDIFED